MDIIVKLDKKRNKFECGMFNTDADPTLCSVHDETVWRVAFDYVNVV